MKSSLKYVLVVFTEDDLSPQPFEISFCSFDNNGDSSMTWCYPQPRVLSGVTVMPIPVNVPDDISQLGDDDLMVSTCVLRFSSLYEQ